MFGKNRKFLNHRVAKLTTARAKNMIQLADGSGQIQYISPEEWHETILPQGIKNAWNDPDHLSALILKAIQIGFSEEMLLPAERLRVIDKNSGRSANILAIVYLKLQRAQDAERLLLEEMLLESDFHPRLMKTQETIETPRDEFRQARYE